MSSIKANLVPGPLPASLQLTEDGKLKHFLTTEALTPQQTHYIHFRENLYETGSGIGIYSGVAVSNERKKFTLETISQSAADPMLIGLRSTAIEKPAQQ